MLGLEVFSYTPTTISMSFTKHYIEILNVYDIEKSIVMKLLDTNDGRVTITLDM